jgi:murein DD-endopeptidase MepM/ murein hydrolase activator NlpD
MQQIFFRAKIAAITAAAVIVIGNLIGFIVRDKVKVPDNAYTYKEGFPIFTSEKEYIKMLRAYPHNMGTKLKFHTMENGESFWDISMRYNISVDTIIAANPFLKSLNSQDGVTIALPAKDGVLLAFNDFLDVRKMKRLLGGGIVRGSWLPGIFSLISLDDIRVVFIEGPRPVIVNNSMEKIYKYKNIFQIPVKGGLVSLYGDRVDPFDHGLMEFHNGIDIIARMRDPIRPAREGMVTFTGWRSGYGNTIIVQHWDGYTTLYGHCSAINVKSGDWVTRETVIGEIGSTGRSTGPHLHYMIMRHGQELDPLFFIW